MNKCAYFKKNCESRIIRKAVLVTLKGFTCGASQFNQLTTDTCKERGTYLLQKDRKASSLIFWLHLVVK